MTLDHEPQAVARKLMLDLALGVAPDEGSDWQIHKDYEPADPDRVVTVAGTAGVQGGTSQVDGEMFEKHGLQVRVRGRTVAESYAKVKEIDEAFKFGVLMRSVTLDGVRYAVHCVRRTGSLLPVERDTPTSRRSVHTLNALMTVRQAS